MNDSPKNRLLARTIIVSQFAPPFMFSGVAVALPTMGKELNAGGTALSLVETLFLAGSLAFLLPSGRLADAGDKRTLYKWGLLGFAILSLLIGSMSSMKVILGLRFFQGMAASVFAATGGALLVDVVPVDRRGRAFGSSLGAIYAGLTLGPIVAGWLVQNYTWRAVFHFGAFTLLASYGLTRAMVKSTLDIPLRVLHFPSVLFVVAASLMLVFGSSLISDGIIGYLLIVGGIFSAATFVVVQYRLERPLLKVRALMANRVLRNALFVQMLVYFQAMSAMFLLSLYLQVSLKFPADKTGPVLATGSIVMAILAPFTGRLADRFRPSILSSIGVAAILLTGVMAIRLNSESSAMYVRALLVLQGFGFALFSSPNMTTIMNSVSVEKTSIASALAAKARSLGMVIGMLIVSVLISVYIGTDAVGDHPEALIKIVSATFSILVGATAIAFGVSCFGSHATRREEPAVVSEGA